MEIMRIIIILQREKRGGKKSYNTMLDGLVERMKRKEE